MEAPHLNRRLTAILMADVVGYSRLMSTDESGTHTRFAAHIKELIDPAIALYGGRPVRSMGDGLLIEFDSAIAAVRAALDIQRGIAARDGEVPEDQRIRLRIGINTGDVIVEDRDIYGHSVNVAARLESLAGPGEIYVAQSVHDHLRGVPGLAFEDRGEVRLKNIDHPVHVFRVVEAPDENAAIPDGLRERVVFVWRQAFRMVTSRPRAAIPLVVVLMLIGGSIAGISSLRDYTAFVPRSSIVVLPFKNLSDDRSQDYFADAITDDLTTDLSRLPGAFVIARATAFTYKDRTVDARQVGRECGVRYILEGSVRRIGQRVQVNAQLVDASSGAQIWADRVDREIKDLWELQETVTGRIATSLDIQLARAESIRAEQNAQSSDPDAIDLRLRAMGLYISGIKPENTLAARKLLEQAVQRDPDSAEAWAWLGDLLASDYLNRWNDAGEEQLQQAESAVRRALAIDPNIALAHFAYGFVHRARGMNTAALDSFSEALKLNPNFARAYAQKANELINAGRPNDAPALVQKAIALSPRDPSLGVFYWNLGRAQFFIGNYREAIPWLRKAVELRPNLWHNWLYLASAHALVGDSSEAARVLGDFNRHPSFQSKNVTIAVVRDYERANPSSNPVIVEGRRQFHEGLLKAGMATN